MKKDDPALSPLRIVERLRRTTGAAERERSGHALDDHSRAILFALDTVAAALREAGYQS